MGPTVEVSCRDQTRVAGNSLPGTGPKHDPSRRDGMIDSGPRITSARFYRLRSPVSDNTSLIPTRPHRILRDGFCIPSIPGNKLPGYPHLVPPGHFPDADLFSLFLP